MTSKISKMWPISDAGLGAIAYTFEMLMAWMGGKTRWRTMPWMVTFFFVLVVPLGVTSIVLVILQPVAVGYWCTLCLATAMIMLVMIPFTVDEVAAMGQFLRRTVQEGNPFWRTFWIGGTLRIESLDERTPHYGTPAKQILSAAAWGVSVPWNLLASAVLGLWLMFAPAVFGTKGRAADSDHVVGALVTTVAIIVMAEVLRARQAEEGSIVKLYCGIAAINRVRACAGRLFSWNGGPSVGRPTVQLKNGINILKTPIPSLFLIPCVGLI